VVFDSSARNLVGGDTNAASDVFVHDRQTGQTTRVSVTTDGTQGNGHSTWPSISGDGQYVTFVSKASNLVSGDTNGVSDVFVHDRKTGQPTRASTASDGTQGNGGSQNPSLSFDGRYVVFWSGATNLIDGDTNGVWDIFVHDRETGETTRVSVASDGTQGNDISRFPSISADGRYVAFESDADNLVSGDTNGFSDIFVHDRETGETICVSIPGE
jgi:Tol biopolymer transport system component